MGMLLLRMRMRVLLLILMEMLAVLLLLIVMGMLMVLLMVLLLPSAVKVSHARLLSCRSVPHLLSVRRGVVTGVIPGCIVPVFVHDAAGVVAAGVLVLIVRRLVRR